VAPGDVEPVNAAKHSWKLFTYIWSDPTPGDHTLVSRAIDVTGKVQPTQQELESRKTFLEDNSQFPRTSTIT
jgi:hypothetical protein